MSIPSMSGTTQHWRLTMTPVSQHLSLPNCSPLQAKPVAEEKAVVERDFVTEEKKASELALMEDNLDEREARSCRGARSLLLIASGSGVASGAAAA